MSVSARQPISGCVSVEALREELRIRGEEPIGIIIHDFRPVHRADGEIKKHLPFIVG